MSTHSFFKVTGSIFFLIAALHLLRSFYGWEVFIGGVSIPLWASWLAVIVAGFLSYTAFTKK